VKVENYFVLPTLFGDFKRHLLSVMQLIRNLVNFVDRINNNRHHEALSFDFMSLIVRPNKGVLPKCLTISQ